MLSLAYTRESLVAEWAQLRPTETMSIELQNLFLKFASAPTSGRTFGNRRPNYVPAHDAPPPRRFQRGASSRLNHETAPQGPLKAIDVQVDKAGAPFGAFSNSLPLGPAAESGWPQPGEMDLTFEAMNGTSYAV